MPSKQEIILRSLAACIRSDGVVREQEKVIFDRLLAKFTEVDKSVALGWLEKTQVLDPSRLRAAFTNQSERADVLKTIVSAALADGKLQLEEVNFLGNFLAALEMSYDELTAIQEQDAAGAD